MTCASRHLTILLVATTLCLVSTGAAAAQRLGVVAGLNRAGSNGDAPPKTQYTGGTGFLAGIVFDRGTTT